VLEHVGDDGAGDGHGCVPARRIDGDHADDGVGCVRADDAGEPAPCRLAGCRCEGYEVQELAALTRDRDGDVLADGWFVHAWHDKSRI